MVNNTILIGKYIYKFLIEDKDLKSMVGANVFPLIAEEDVKYPFIVYAKENIVPNYVKNFACQDNVSLRFYIVSNSYEQSLDIANQVRHILENKRFQDNVINIQEMRIESVTESYEEDAFIQTMYVSAVCGNV